MMERYDGHGANPESETVADTADKSAGSVSSWVLPRAAARIGDILVDLGFVERAMVEGAAAMQAYGIEKRLGELLVENGHVTSGQLERALSLQKKAGKPRDNVDGRPHFQEAGHVTESHLARAVARRHGLPFVRLGGLLNSPESFISNMLPLKLKSRLKAIPVEKDAGRLLIVLEDPADRNCLSELVKIAGCPVDPVVSTPTEILYVLKNYAVQEARRAAEQAGLKERLAAKNVSEDESARELLRTAEEEAAEARLAAQKAELEERLAAQKLATERAEEERGYLEGRFMQEKAAIERRFAAQQRALEERLAEAVATVELSTRERARLEQAFAEPRGNLNRQLADEKEALKKRFETEKETLERLAAERINAELAALEERFSAQLNSAEERLKAERRMFEERLAAEHALAEKAASEKADLERRLAEVISERKREEAVSSWPASAEEKKAQTEDERTIKLGPKNTGTAKWWLRGVATAAVVALAISIYLVAGGQRSEKMPLPAPTTTATTLPGHIEEPVKEVQPPQPVQPETSRAMEANAEPQQHRVHRARHISKSPGGVRKKDRQAIDSMSDKDRQDSLKSLQNQIMSGEIVLERLDAKLNALMKELEGQKKELDSEQAANGGKVKAGAQVDAEKRQRTAEEYNDNVRRYNKLVSEAKQTATEYDSIRQQNWELAEKYRNLAASR